MRTQARTIEDIAGAIRQKIEPKSYHADEDWRVEVIPMHRGQWTWRVVGPIPATDLNRLAVSIGMLQRRFSVRH